MIVVSGVLVLVALVFLIIGLLGEGLTFIWASIITSFVAGVFLLLGALQRRGAPAAEATGDTTGSDALERVTAVNVRPRDAEEAPASDDAAAAATGGAGAPEVSVVPGRPRYHVAGCRFLAGRPDVESMPVDGAREQGFTACGVCKPDAAIAAAEAAAAAPADEPVADDTAVIDVAAAADAVDEADVAPPPARKPARKAPAKTAAASARGSAATATAEPPAAEAAAAGATGPDGGTPDTGATAPAKAAKPARKTAAKAATGGATAASGGAAGANQVVVIPDRGKFHVETCRFVKDVPGTVTLAKTTAKRQGYTPCGVCKP